MSKTLKDLEPVGKEFLDSPKSQTVVHEFDVPVEQLWRSLLDAAAWEHWLELDKLYWTSEEPLGLHATRTIEVGSDIIEEYFFDWDEGRRMSFHFVRSTLPIRAMAEDYLVEANGTGSRLTWTFRVDAFFILVPLLNGRMKSAAAKGFPKLEALIKSDPERFTSSA